MAKAYQHTSHESFDHDSIDSFGFDWERIGDPSIKPKRPLKIYLPESTDELVAIAREAATLGQKLSIRSNGHSSNDLVLTYRGAVVGMQMLRGIVKLETDQARVTVYSGTVLAELDEQLNAHGLGLKVIGDHNHITVGGFASVGGISPASHRHGLFLDTVFALELVTWEGELLHFDRTLTPKELDWALGATGKVGMIATLTLELDRVDKWKTIVRNHRYISCDMDKFISHSANQILHPGDALMERGIWLEYPVAGRKIRIGQFSAYHATKQGFWARLVNGIAYGWLHFLGHWAGRLPKWLDYVFKMLGMVGIVFSPRYATLKNVETFTDRVIDSSIADPTRMLILLAPMDQYEALFKKLQALLVEYRDRHGCITFIAFYVKGISSPWLSGGTGALYSELMLYLGCVPEKLTPERLGTLVKELDDLCIEHGGLRYMHTKTSKDEDILRQVDPHAQYTKPAEGR